MIYCSGIGLQFRFMTLVSQSIDPGQSMVRVIVFRPTLGLIRGPVQWYIGLHGRGSPVVVIM